MLLSLIIVSAASANEFAAGSRQAADQYDGIQGRQGIRTDPATVSNTGYVHPVQADVGPVMGDFVGVGTYKGKGASSCPSDFDPVWSGYWDRVTAGIYSCDEFSIDTYNSGAVIPFEIAYKFCNSAAANRWVLTFNLTIRECVQSSAATASGVVAGLETAGPETIDRNIDVKYTLMKRNLVGSSTWVDFGQPIWTVDDKYDSQFVSNQAFNVYLAPLD